MSDIREDLRYLSEEYESGEHVDISAQNYFQEALDEINRLRGILHRVANEERRISKLAEKARYAARDAEEAYVCGPFLELADWYTFGDDDE